MKLTNQQIVLMKEAGIEIPANIANYIYTAEDEDLLADLLMDSLAPGQEWTVKAQEIQNLLNYLAER